VNGTPASVAFRIVAAVSEPVSVLLLTGRWRSDFGHRMAGITIRLPALRERASDIPGLVAHFLAERNGHPAKVLAPGALALLQRYAWPGNVRELRALVQRLDVLVDEPVLTAAHVRQHLSEVGAPVPPRVGRASRGNGEGHAAELRGRLVEALAMHQWDVDRAATALGVHRATLFRHLKVLGLSVRFLRKSH
jgi:DNA-binding NtrC family response regulator